MTPAMARSIALIASAAIFAAIGVAAGYSIVSNLPADFSDRYGIMTAFLVLLPTTTGLVVGFVVGLLAVAKPSGLGN